MFFISHEFFLHNRRKVFAVSFLLKVNLKAFIEVVCRFETFIEYINVHIHFMFAVFIMAMKLTKYKSVPIKKLYIYNHSVLC